MISSECMHLYLFIFYLYVVKLHFYVESIISLNIKEISVRLVSIQSVPNRRYRVNATAKQNILSVIFYAVFQFYRHRVNGPNYLKNR